MKLRLFTAATLILSAVGLGAQEVRRAMPVQSLAAADVANFLAGVPLPQSSPLSALQRTRTYQAHVTALAKLSQHYDRHYFSKMQAWSAAELAPRIPMRVPVFYFFAGPDAVSVLALFPDAPVYVLGGLESVGSITPPNALTEGEVVQGLDNLRKSAEVILSFGHFITKDMKAELDRTAFRGVLPLIYTFIALAGGEVVSTQYLSVVGGGSPGVRIEFRRRGRSDVQTLYYVQANVADEALRPNGALLKWAGSFGAGNVYLKAASYLLHESYFSRIRSFLLNQAISVLQDDSGIPFRFFRDGNWRLWLFGTYSGTLDIFTKYYQSDLQAAFAAPGAAIPLPFGTGYKWRLGESNVMLAVKQSIPQTQPPEAVPLRP
jgi:hypothetical protein